MSKGSSLVDAQTAMMADGIYRVDFETLLDAGRGIVVIGGDNIRGGDDFFAYFGTIQRRDNGFLAEIETKRHSPGRASVFGIDEVNIQLSGMMDGLNAICTGAAKQMPGLIFKAVLTFIPK
jgi:T3SS negative regulator,GrlR